MKNDVYDTLRKQKKNWQKRVKKRRVENIRSADLARYRIGDLRR